LDLWTHFIGKYLKMWIVVKHYLVTMFSYHRQIADHPRYSISYRIASPFYSWLCLCWPPKATLLSMSSFWLLSIILYTRFTFYLISYINIILSFSFETSLLELSVQINEYFPEWNPISMVSETYFQSSWSNFHFSAAGSTQNTLLPSLSVYTLLFTMISTNT